MMPWTYHSFVLWDGQPVFIELCPSLVVLLHPRGSYTAPTCTVSAYRLREHGILTFW